jgi:hypothetical protein
MTEEDVLRDGKGRDQAELLKDHADAESASIVRRAYSYRSALDFDLTIIRRIDPLQDLHEGRFARAVAADKGVNLAPTQIEIDLVQDAVARKTLADPGHLHRVEIHLPHPCSRQLVGDAAWHPKLWLVDYCPAASCSAAGGSW